MPKKPTDKKETDSEVVSFRLYKELHKELKDWAVGEMDDRGRPMNPSKFARKLILEALSNRKKQKKR